MWGKWTDTREQLARTAAYCWIPTEDLQEALNAMAGERLTITDVAQRLRAFNEEAYEPWPQDELQEGCLEIYRRERAEGTGMAAIVGAIQEFVEGRGAALQEEQRRRYRETVEANKIALQERLRSGADCKWTPLDGSPHVFCRINGRIYRLDTMVDGTVLLQRIADLKDVKGQVVGRYRRRADATKALKEVAYAAEPGW